jgi:hypothetical protein
MIHSDQMLTAVVHSVHALLRPSGELGASDQDRGAVSIEQVLWYAAAAVSVAVVATIIWSQIKSTAGTSVNTPSAP